MIVDRITKLFSSSQKIEASPEITADIKKNYNSHRPLGPQPVACYAPFKNMYFGQQGNVNACCYNRRHVLGVYPAQSIKEMWLGDKANELREYLKQYNFSKGCFGCSEQLVAGNMDGAKAKQYDANRSNSNRYPSVMEFELDNTCNLECVMCSGEFSSLIRTKREKRAELPKVYDDEFIRQLEEFIPYLEEAKFYGGEPFLMPSYFKIWDKIIELNPGIRIMVQTNGTTVNTRVKEILQHANFQINMSIDSLDKERYESIRVNSSFETVMQNLEYFLAYSKERNNTLCISACIMLNNWFEAPEFIRFCNAKGINISFHTVVGPDFLSLKKIASEKLQEIYATLFAELDGFPETTVLQKKNKQHYQDFILQILDWSKRKHDNPETDDIHTVPQLAAFLIQKTNERKDLDDAGKKASADIITAKMNELEKLVPAGLSINRMIKDLDVRDESQLKAGLEATEKMNVVDEVINLKRQMGLLS